MGDTLITVIAIFLTAVLMFVFPLMSLSARNDNITQISVQTLTSEFVDKISTKGILTQEDYETYLKNLASTGNTYDITLEIQVLDDNPNKITTTAGDLIGENARYSIYTSTILEKYLYNQEEKNQYKLQQGDNVIVTATNTNTTTAQTIRNFIYTMVGKDTYKISAKSASMVVHGTKKVTLASGGSGDTGETPQEPQKTLEFIYEKNTNAISYKQGEPFNSNGIAIFAHYTDGTDKLLIAEKDYELPTIDTTYNVGTVTVPITYTENKKTVTTSFDITVNSIYEYNDNNPVITGITNKDIETLIIPSTINGKEVTGIGMDAFFYCTKLTTVEIPSTMKTIGMNAFQSCLNLKNITIPTGVTTIEEGAFQSTKITIMDIPDTVESIGEGAFAYCGDLSGIRLSNNIKELPKDIFRDCSSLTKIEIPEGIKSIGMNAFFYCIKLTEVTIPTTVETIGIGAFQSCWKLDNITIPDRVTKISKSVFNGCQSLVNVTMHNNITTIEATAFASCNSLKSITIPNSIEKIEDYAFKRCSNLTEIRVPRNMTVPTNKWGATNANIIRY